jgi:ATP-binding cassette subfamily B (MDR/TAP) protein 10
MFAIICISKNFNIQTSSRLFKVSPLNNSIRLNFTTNNHAGLFGQRVGLRPSNPLRPVNQNAGARNGGKNSLSSYLTLFVRQMGRDAKKAAKAEEIKNVKVNSNGIRRLMTLAKPDKWNIAFALFLLVISSSVTMSVPFFIGKLIDFVQSGDKAEMKKKLRDISLILTGVFIVGALANFGRVYIIQSTGQKIVARLRKRLFRSVMSQDMAFFDKNKTGELINRLSTDTEVVGLSISQNLSDGLRSTIQAAGGVGMMLYVSPYLATIGLSVVPAVTVFALWFGRYIKQLSKKVQDVLAEATEVTENKII